MDVLIDIVLQHPTIKKFAEPIRTLATPAAEVVGTIERHLNESLKATLSTSEENHEDNIFVSDRTSRYAARIIIEIKTQKAYIYAGAFDSTFEVSLGV